MKKTYIYDIKTINVLKEDYEYIKKVAIVQKEKMYKVVNDMIILHKKYFDNFDFEKKLEKK